MPRYDAVRYDPPAPVAQAVELDMIFLQRAFRGRYLLIDDDRGILGRDVLGGVAVLLNGPGQEWAEHQTDL